MVANTTRGITYPTGTDQVAPLHPIFATMATSIDTALGKILYRPADLAALAAITGMVSGDVAIVTEGGAQFEYNGTTWIQVTPASFSSSAVRDTAYAKASGVYRTTGARVRRPEGWIEHYISTPTATTAGWYALDGARPTGSLNRTTDAAGGVNTTATAAVFQGAPLTRGTSWVVGSPTKLTINNAGRYLLSAIAGIGSTATGSAWFRINGTINRPAHTETNSGGLAIVGVTDVVSLAVGDYVELMTLSNGAFNLYANTALTADLIGTP
jgi:hypothetical protein